MNETCDPVLGEQKREYSDTQSAFSVVLAEFWPDGFIAEDNNDEVTIELDINYH